MHAQHQKTDTFAIREDNAKAKHKHAWERHLRPAKRFIIIEEKIKKSQHDISSTSYVVLDLPSFCLFRIGNSRILEGIYFSKALWRDKNMVRFQRNLLIIMALAGGVPFIDALLFVNIGAARPINPAFQAKRSAAAVKTVLSYSVKAEASEYPILADGDDIMRPKAHGSSEKPAQSDLKWGMDFETADRICNYNRRFAEYKGYATNFLNMLERKARDEGEFTTNFYDSVTGNLLFTAPMNRTVADFVEESKAHGWPSFRDDEVNWELVRCVDEDECVSITGTHLGHNIPDEMGNRYCINLVSIAGRPIEELRKKNKWG